MGGVGFAPKADADIVPERSEWDAVMYRGETMKPFQLSWLLGVLSYVILGVLRRSGLLEAETSLGTQRLITFLLLILSVSAGTGTVLGVMSWNRKEVKTWWAIGAIVLNLVVLLTVILRLFAG